MGETILAAALDDYRFASDQPSGRYTVFGRSRTEEVIVVGAPGPRPGLDVGHRRASARSGETDGPCPQGPDDSE